MPRVKSKSRKPGARKNPEVGGIGNGFRKRKGFYEENFGGKDENREIHHIKPVSEGGGNQKWNLSYLFSWIHTLYHHLLLRNEIDYVKFPSGKPSMQKQIDLVSDACIKKEQEKLFAEQVKLELKSRGA